MIENITLGQIAVALAFAVSFIASAQTLAKKLTSPLTSIEGKVDSLAEETRKHFRLLDEANSALIHDRIEACYYRKAVERGFITMDDYKTVTRLYESYRESGGNGVVAKEMEYINSLPIRQK